MTESCSCSLSSMVVIATWFKRLDSTSMALIISLPTLRYSAVACSYWAVNRSSFSWSLCSMFSNGIMV
ncbi:Uncharacterised protein [Vibrio cholerae]|nr:Uncharacterised protein [Vibrio cholerae]CSB70678.1 Uncharacterised protein [Vibrio cholerae]CSI55005.1 Uncharacterised protein [Vibrio cholerae]CSI62172.1 Uncharacterised protein [Vibrio cholerae]